jgi:hypothetical protein
MAELFDDLEKRLDDLGDTTVEVYAEGNYPDKKETKVQNVAVWQNDGTERIKAAKFVEAAVKKHREWKTEMGRAIARFLNGEEKAFEKFGARIAEDIGIAVNRIDTGRLKRSMVYRIKDE